jgi:tetratricopeptide (TPR) repeat protein
MLLAEIGTIVGIAGGIVGLVGGGGGLIGLWRSLRQERREQHEAFFATYEKSIAALKSQYERETDSQKKDENKQRLETVESEYHQQLEAYRQNSALRQSAPRGLVAPSPPLLAETLRQEQLRELLDKAKPLSPALLTTEDYFLRGNTAYELRRYEDALAAYNRSLELRPDDPDTLNNRGVTLDDLKRYEEALADYNRSLELRPDDPDTLNNRGNALHHLNRYDEALTEYNRALELRPDHPDTLNNRGITLNNLKRYDEALADYNRALELRPDDPSTLNSRGINYGHMERYNEALEDFGRALEVAPEDPNPIYNKACLLALMDRLLEALDQVKEAITRDGKYRKMAREDDDFANLRADLTLGPEFERLVAEPED